MTAARRPTVVDVARAANVSVGTVSNVVSGARTVRPETRERVELAIAELGFRPNTIARALIRRRTQTVGMVIPDVTNPFFSDLIWEVERALAEADYAVVFGNSANDPGRERRYLEAFSAEARPRLRRHSFRGRGLQPGLSESDWAAIRERAYEGRGG